MMVKDLIEELKKFPELATVYVQNAEANELARLDCVEPVWTIGPDADGCYHEVTENATDFGALLYG